MVKEFAWFTEMAHMAHPVEEVSKRGYSTLMFPNTFFNPAKAVAAYDMYFDEYEYALDQGWDGLMTNEHHDAPFCMQTCNNIIATHLVHMVKKKPKARIICLGNPLPIMENPVRTAEELAMIDLISGGRLVSGFIRGGAVESVAANVNPTYNRERLEEAHDLIVKTWTTPGPFRWEGKHYQIRVVNPWVLPVQKPHPPIWIPGLRSPETIVFAAKHRYPFINLGTVPDVTAECREIYHKVAAEDGWTPNSDHFGGIIRVVVQDTDEQAYEAGRCFWYERGNFTGTAASGWASPPGYNSRAATVSFMRRSGEALRGASYESANAELSVITGNPATVIKKLQYLCDTFDPGFFAVWGREGSLSHAAARRNIELMGREVIPAMKQYQSRLSK